MTFTEADVSARACPTRTPIEVDDLVRLNSGSPLGLVSTVADGLAAVIWLNADRDRSVLPTACLTPLRA